MGFLTDLKIRTLPPSAKEQMLNDGDGLYLRVRTSSKSWLYRYKPGEKQIKIGLGAYPTVTLAMARTHQRGEHARCALKASTRRTLGESSKSKPRSRR